MGTGGAMSGDGGPDSVVGVLDVGSAQEDGDRGVGAPSGELWRNSLMISWVEGEEGLRMGLGRVRNLVFTQALCKYRCAISGYTFVVLSFYRN